MRILLKNLAYLLFEIPRIRRHVPVGVDLFCDLKKRLPDFSMQIIFDVGANVGQSALEFARRRPDAEIFAFEPIRETYDNLCANARKRTNIHCFPFALGHEEGEARIALQELSVCNSLLNTVSEQTPHNELPKTETVHIKRLTSFCKEHGIDHIDFLKIDTEGYDLEVLKGAEQMLIEHRVKIVQVEAGTNPSNKKHVPLEHLKNYMEGLGYDLFGIYYQKHEHTGEPRLRFCNLAFISEQAARSSAK